MFPAKVAPAREASDFSNRIERAVEQQYAELLILKFKATNTERYNFASFRSRRNGALYEVHSCTNQCRV